MAKKKVSLITTVKNEGESIAVFLTSVLDQTKHPDEFIIVDAQSIDGTADIIKSYKREFEKKKIHFVFINKKGNRSVGRNTAIKKARNNIIACSDAGCELKKNWFATITKPFRTPEVRELLVAGYYTPTGDSLFQKALATYTSVMPDRFDKKTFLPSSRSVAFTKEAWEKVGGYPEDLDTCEDLIFAQRLKKAGVQFVFAEKAIVFWPQMKTIPEAFWQFFNYARGDGKALLIRSSTPFLFGRYIIGGILLYMAIISVPIIFGILVNLFILYLIWAIAKNYHYIRNWKAIIYLPILQITADIAVISGMLIGLTDRIK